MMWFYPVLFILIIIILFSRLNIILQYTYDQYTGCGLIHLSVYFYHMKIYQKQINPLEFANHSTIWRGWEGKTALQRIQYIPKGVKSILNQFTIQYKQALPFLRKTKIKEFTWVTECGTGTALTSGTACGVLWTVKGMVVRLLKNKTGKIQGLHLNIHPHFQREVLRTHLHCIVTFTIGKAIIAFFSYRYGKKSAVERKDPDG